MRYNLSEKIHQINYLISEINNLYHKAAVILGISDSSQIVLYTICDCNENCDLKEIYKRSGISKQTVNSAIRKLEKDGIIALANKDGRAKTVSLTEKGKKLAEDTVYKLYNMEYEIYSEFSEKEIDDYIKLNERYVTAFREKLKI